MTHMHARAYTRPPADASFFTLLPSTRVAYEEPDYVAMAKYALEAWRELEAAAGEELLLTTGGITIANGCVGPGNRA